MTTNHTPTPWQLDAGTGSILGPKTGCSHPIITNAPIWWAGKQPGEHASQDIQAANAQFIVRAANNYQALVDALREMISMVDEMLPKAGPCGWGTIATDNARAALAAAQEVGQ